MDFADDLPLPAYIHEQMRVKTIRVSEHSASVGPNIHNGKLKVLEYNMENTNTTTLDGEALEEV